MDTHSKKFKPHSTICKVTPSDKFNHLINTSCWNNLSKNLFLFPYIKTARFFASKRGLSVWLQTFNQFRKKCLSRTSQGWYFDAFWTETCPKIGYMKNFENLRLSFWKPHGHLGWQHAAMHMWSRGHQKTVPWPSDNSLLISPRSHQQGAHLLRWWWTSALRFVGYIPPAKGHASWRPVKIWRYISETLQKDPPEICGNS